MLPHCQITSRVVLSNLKIGVCMTALSAIIFAIFWYVNVSYQYIFLLIMIMGTYSGVREYNRYKKMKVDEKDNNWV